VISTLFGGWTLNLSGEVTVQKSTIATYEYDNIRGQALLSKRFEF
jgi:hypothetical protein